MELRRHSSRADPDTGYGNISAKLLCDEVNFSFANTSVYIGGSSSLSFARNGELFVCGGQTLWRVQLNGPIFYGP